MEHREYWTKELREAEAELGAAPRRSDVDAAAKKLQGDKTELKAAFLRRGGEPTRGA